MPTSATPRLRFQEPQIPGWIHLDSMWFLADLVCEHAPDRCVEIGSAMGRSAYAIASALQHLGGDRSLTCIDVWSWTIDDELLDQVWLREMMSWFDPDTIAEYLPANLGKTTRDCFDLTLDRFPFMQRLVTPLQADTKQLELDSNTIFDFAFLDGGHTYDSIASDIRLITPHLSSGAIIVFDDCIERFPDVIRAVDEFADRASVTHLQTHRGLRAYRID